MSGEQGGGVKRHERNCLLEKVSAHGVGGGRSELGFIIL